MKNVFESIFTPALLQLRRACSNRTWAIITACIDERPTRPCSEWGRAIVSGVCTAKTPTRSQLGFLWCSTRSQRFERSFLDGVNLYAMNPRSDSRSCRKPIPATVTIWMNGRVIFGGIKRFSDDRSLFCSWALMHLRKFKLYKKYVG